MEDNNDNLKEFKVVLVGEAAVGKTCIIKRFATDEFKPDELTSSTASFITKTIKLDGFEEKYIKFNIWDTCGQEKFRSVGKIFYTGIQAAILVYDITSKRNFEELKNFWINQINEYAPNNVDKFYFFN